MANRSVQILILAKDLASPQFGKVQAAAKGLTGSFNTLSTAANFLGLSLGVGTLGAAIKASLAAFAEDQRAAAQLEAALLSTGHAAGWSGEQVKRLASQLQQTTVFADETTVAAASLLATFTRVRGDVFRGAIVAAQDLSTRLRTDLQSSILQVGKALQDPVRGITALRRAGVSFTVEQQQLIKTMVATNNLMGAQKIILKELATEFGGAAAADSETFAGKIEQLKNTIGDLGETIGGTLAPALAKAAEQFKALIEAMNNVPQQRVKDLGADIRDRARRATQDTLVASREQERAINLELVGKRAELTKRGWGLLNFRDPGNTGLRAEIAGLEAQQQLLLMEQVLLKFKPERFNVLSMVTKGLDASGLRAAMDTGKNIGQQVAKGFQAGAGAAGDANRNILLGILLGRFRPHQAIEALREGQEREADRQRMRRDAMRGLEGHGWWGAGDVPEERPRMFGPPPGLAPTESRFLAGHRTQGQESNEVKVLQQIRKIVDEELKMRRKEVEILERIERNRTVVEFFNEGLA